MKSERRKLVVTKEMEAILAPVLATLTIREERVVRMRWGIHWQHPGEKLTQSKIGKILDLSHSRIGKIEQNALRKMRHPTRLHRLPFEPWVRILLVLPRPEVSS